MTISAKTQTSFLQTLTTGPLLVDGAMGSLLYERGVLHTRSYEELNLSQPELVRAVHRDYVQAGAQLIETNTFGANRVVLARHGLADRVGEVNRAAVELARSAASDRAHVAGAVGPTGVKFAIATAAERRNARFALAEQIDILVLAGVDAIMLETFSSLLEMETALEVAKQRGPKIPVIAQMVFDAQGRGDGGMPPDEIADRLISAGADVVGANCGIGPAELYNVGASMCGRGRPVILQPNAGLPASIEGRTLYVANPEHFGVFARRMLKSGVSMIGGCCGTTPAHTRAMLGAVRMLSSHAVTDGRSSASHPTVPPIVTSGSSTGSSAGSSTGSSTASGDSFSLASPPRPAPPPVTPLAQKSRLGARIAAGQFAVSVELTAPPGTDMTKTVQQVSELRAGGVDVINIADGPRASARMGNLAVCSELARMTGVEPILHVCARDRNFLGLVAHLLGSHALGIKDLVIITGDPPKMGDYPFATPVYDVDSIGLLRMAAGLNAGIDPAGKEIGGATGFLLATGAEPAAHDRDRELRRLEEKKLAGAELIMTQPVYDPRTLDRFLEEAAPLGLPVMVGILPLASHRNAEFLHHEVPGMSIPPEYRERMAKAPAGPLARAEGIKIAQEALSAVKTRVAGAYVMPPFNKVDSALAVLECVRDVWKPEAR